MKHYLDRHGREVKWEGTAKVMGDHDYFCAHHPFTPLVEGSAVPAQKAHCLRRYGGADYYCPLCDPETRSPESPDP